MTTVEIPMILQKVLHRCQFTGSPLISFLCVISETIISVLLDGGVARPKSGKSARQRRASRRRSEIRARDKVLDQDYYK